jgi:hypothetical protein
MTEAVRADDLRVVDVVMMSSQTGEQPLRIEAVEPRTAAIKFVGRGLVHAERWHWGWPPHQAVDLVERDS